MNRQLYNRIGDLFEAIEEDRYDYLDEMLDALLMLTKVTEIEEIDRHAKGVITSFENYVDYKFKNAKNSVFHGVYHRMHETRIKSLGGE